MSGEPNPSFSNQAGGLAPAGWYCWPPGFGGSTKEKLVCKYIPYPHVPGATPVSDPGLLED